MRGQSKKRQQNQSCPENCEPVKRIGFTLHDSVSFQNHSEDSGLPRRLANPGNWSGIETERIMTERIMTLVQLRTFEIECHGVQREFIMILFKVDPDSHSDSAVLQ